MTAQGVEEFLRQRRVFDPGEFRASRTGVHKGLPYMRHKLVSVVIARSKATKQSPFARAGGS